MARSYKKNRASWVERGATSEEIKDARYRAYLRDYQAQARKLLKYDEYMNSKPLSKEKYLTKWQEYKNDLQKEKEQGKRTSIGNVNQYIVRDQAYAISYKQARGLKEFVKAEFSDDLIESVGEEVSDRELERMIRRGELYKYLNVGDKISEIYKDVRDQYIDELYVKEMDKYLKKGYSTKEAEEKAREDVFHEAVMKAKHDISSTVYGSP